SVRQTINTPGGTQPPITAVVTPQQVQPQQPVPTPRELQPQTPATAIIQVGGAQQPVATQQNNPPITVVNDPPPTIRNAPPQPQQQQVAGADAPDNALARVAQQNGEQLVSVGANGTQTSANGAREYTAQSGDSVSRMASKFFGANTKANREAIIRANPSLQQDANKVIVGKAYRIPSASNTSVAATQQPQQSSQPQSSNSNTAQPASNTEYWYTVQEGDSLWRIANDQLGDTTAIASIKELNKDILRGSDTVIPNMKLRLPSKPVAQATN
ncbi:MAG TPA: LysM peptidoglycan-binding domain-containing protein, partial [Tepidisphaeraceae bacterium]|nr:LysM peptidoglycan-binding domain-containing protein [Tepidisphaeraceae bacterium]